MGSFKLAAHRGFSEFFPENTMLAMREAVKQDIDMVETDVHMTADGELVLMHDHTVDRTTNGTGLVREKTLAQMLELDAGSWKGSEFSGEKVPTFREFLDFMAQYPELEINVELKDYPHLCGDFAFISCDKTLAMLEEYHMTDRIYINCWSGEILSYIAEKYQGKYRLHGYYPMFLNSGKFDKNTYYEKMFCICLFNRELQPDGSIVRLAEPLMAPEHYAFIKEQGVEPWIFIKPTEEYLKKAIEYGAVALTANDVRLSAEILYKIGARTPKEGR